MYYSQSLLHEVYDVIWYIRYFKSSGVYKIVPKKTLKITLMFTGQNSNKDKYKTVPLEILNGKFNVKYAFLAGYYLADGAKCPEKKVKVFVCQIKVNWFSNALLCSKICRF